MLYHPILQHSQIFIILFRQHKFLSFLPEFSMFCHDIPILDFDDIFLIFVDGSQKFSLDFNEVLTYFCLDEETDLFLEDEIWISK